ncbi:hypothetical protein [Petralouisia muris]|uniref:hypothetical protein n=1 Tax=Petralouisia muris TaxID=3032872 RepID=UPI0023B8290A|nr:hypothetical protein [Petralouisia muris]
MGKESKKSQSIKIKSIQANSLYAVNNYVEDESETGNKKPYLDLGEAVINNSLFSEYMIHHAVAVNGKGRSKDFIVLKFDYGFKGGMSAKELRDYYYENGATVIWPVYDKEGNVVKEEPIYYKMLMRSTGKAKEGDCIFIRENLHSTALKYITMDLWDKMPYENAKIVEMSAYAPLVTATAIDYITIPMENILIVKDEDVYARVNAVSVKTHDVPYERKVIDWDATEKLINGYNLTFYKKKRRENPKLKCIRKSKPALKEYGIVDYPTKTKVYYKKECYVDRSDEKAEVKNTLWDGMGCIDESIFPNNMDGFIYCRSHFFKSCLFRGNIQEYFKDYYKDRYETATVTDMFGNAFLAKDIKVIITENSIKWIKFTDIMGGSEKAAYTYYKRFMKKHKERFAIVKTAHASKYGDLQRSSYQINNSLPCVDKIILERIAKVSIDYCNALKLSHKAFMKHLSANAAKRYSINNVLLALDEWNDNFKYTEYFKAKRNGIISRFKNGRLKLGKLLQYGDNLTICGNIIALLMKVTGQNFLEEPCFKQIGNGIQCYTTRFKDGERLAGFRSPHNAPNNIVHLVNTYSQEIQRYFPKLGNNVIVINGIGTDVQSRLNGQDLDTDSVYVTNQSDIVNIAEQAYLNYPTIINDIELNGSSEYKKDMESYAKMDSKISSSQYAIGEASNIAQLALSYYYDGGSKSKELEDVFIICSVLAQVAIDSAKRMFDINVNSELSRLSNLTCMQPEDGKKYPVFYAKVQEQKMKGKKKKKAIDEPEIREFNCPMEILSDIIEENVIDLRKYRELIPYTCNLNTVFRYQTDRNRDSKQYKKVISIVQEYDREVNKLDMSKSDYSKNVDNLFDNCMIKLRNLTINKSTMYSLIAYAFANNGDVRDRILTVLYDKDPKKFLSCFKKTEKSSAKDTGSVDITKVS